MQLKQSYLDLAHHANGKLGLYLHAYINFTFIKFCFPESEEDFSKVLESSVELKRLQGLQNTIVNIAKHVGKFHFDQAKYDSMVETFGKVKKGGNKTKLIEQI
jgi:hypothetical protein